MAGAALADWGARLWGILWSCRPTRTASGVTGWAPARHKRIAARVPLEGGAWGVCRSRLLVSWSTDDGSYLNRRVSSTMSTTVDNVVIKDLECEVAGLRLVPARY